MQTLLAVTEYRFSKYHRHNDTIWYRLGLAGPTVNQRADHFARFIGKEGLL